MEIVCSALAGISARVLCHPLDTIKTVTFTGFAGEHHIPTAGGAAKVAVPTAAAAAAANGSLPLSAVGLAPRSSFLASARSIYVREGVTGFYRGLGVAAIGSAPGVALYLTTYHRGITAWKDFGEVGSISGGSDSSLRAAAAATPMSVRHFVCGLAAEAVSCLVWVPIDISKERLQSQPPSLKARYTSSLDALRRISANEGLAGLYKGYFSTLASFGPFSAVYFVFYEYFTELLDGLGGDGRALGSTNTSSTLSSRQKFMVALGAGAGSNVVASLCTNPLELVKTRLQVQRAVLQRQSKAAGAAQPSPSLFAYHYNGLRDGVAKVVKTEGVLALWKGVGSRIAFTAPNAALTMGFFELFKSSVMGEGTS